MSATQYPIVTICGSMRFSTRMLEVATDYTRNGWVVLMPFVVTESGQPLKKMLDDMHFTKISMSEMIVVVNYDPRVMPARYIGDSTSREIKYAEDHGIKVKYTGDTDTKGSIMSTPLTDQQIEQAIAERHLDGPRVTPEHVNALIDSVEYHHFYGTTVTVCRIQLRNGFNLIGHSAAVSMDNFDTEIGRAVAYQAAYDKIWMVEGYLLREHLYRKGQ